MAVNRHLLKFVVTESSIFSPLALTIALVHTDFCPLSSSSSSLGYLPPTLVCMPFGSGLPQKCLLLALAHLWGFVSAPSPLVIQNLSGQYDARYIPLATWNLTHFQTLKTQFSLLPFSLYCMPKRMATEACPIPSDLIETMDRSFVVCIDFEAPNIWPAMLLGHRPTVDSVTSVHRYCDRVLTLCPYTAQWMNNIMGVPRVVPTFYPIDTYRDLPPFIPLGQRTYDVIALVSFSCAERLTAPLSRALLSVAKWNHVFVLKTRCGWHSGIARAPQPFGWT